MKLPFTEPSTNVNLTSSSVSWLAMGLAFAYLTVMASIMWLFENALTIVDVTNYIGDPHRINLWLLILLSAVLIFLLSRWSLDKISTVKLAEYNRDTNLIPVEIQSRFSGWLLLGVLATLITCSGGYLLHEQEKTIEAAQFRQISTTAFTVT